MVKNNSDFEAGSESWRKMETESGFMKFLWRLITWMGILFTMQNIYRCGKKVPIGTVTVYHFLFKFYEYPVTTDVSISSSQDSNISYSFPTVTICLNSMHSQDKVMKIHSDDQLLLKSLSFLYGFYSDTHNASIEGNRLECSYW